MLLNKKRRGRPVGTTKKKGAGSKSAPGAGAANSDTGSVAPVDINSVYNTPTEDYTENAEFTQDPDKELKAGGDSAANVTNDDDEDIEDFDDDFDPPGDDEEETEGDEETGGSESPKMSLQAQAKMWIGVANAFSEPALRGMLKKKRFPKETAKRWREAKKKLMNLEALTPEEEKLRQLYLKFQKQAKFMKMTAEEKEACIDPLAQCLAKWGGKIPPELALAMTFGSYAYSRMRIIFFEDEDYEPDEF